MSYTNTFRTPQPRLIRRANTFRTRSIGQRLTAMWVRFLDSHIVGYHDDFTEADKAVTRREISKMLLIFAGITVAGIALVIIL